MYVADAKRLTAAGAKKIMAAAIARAQDAGIALTVAIVDAGGHLVLLERMEGQALDVAHALGLSLAAGAERWTAMEGGCPIMLGTECIGAVGVAGGDWQFDERVAREAAESLK
jgi:glc operon protein GlcG